MVKALKPGVTLLVPAKDEEPRIGAFLKQFEPYMDAIIVVEDGSADRTVEIAEKYADKVIQLDPAKLPKPTHQVEVYNEGLKHVETEWILTADCDEIWDKGFLENLKRIIAERPKVVCFRFPRCNLPHGKDYPDYQTRLVKTIWVVWRHEPHITPYFRGKKTDSEEIVEYPMDRTTEVITLDNYPIIHLPRRKDLQRPWWNRKW